MESNNSGGGNETLKIYLYPNAWNDDNLVEKDAILGQSGVVYAGVKILCDQLTTEDLIGSYEIYVSYEHPGVKGGPNAHYDSYIPWKTYDGPNDKNSVTGCHVLVYQSNLAPSNGVADELYHGKGAFRNPQNAIIVQGAKSTGYATRNIAIHEVAHTIIVDDSVTEIMGDSDTTDGVDHELGQVYPGYFGDGPISPMCTGYESTAAREGECSNESPWNLGYDHDLTSCAKKAIEHTSNN